MFHVLSKGLGSLQKADGICSIASSSEMPELTKLCCIARLFLFCGSAGLASGLMWAKLWAEDVDDLTAAKLPCCQKAACS